jgi:N-acetylglucosamine kinase-like BadF-type ATPase
MILIADGGSTNTEWRLIDEARSFILRCGGINPYFNSEEQIAEELKKMQVPISTSKIDEIYFYGAGLTGDKVREISERAFINFFGVTRIFLYDDLTAACRALFKMGSGIGCILGTGSNSGLYIEGEVKDKIPPLGYILGDEGSGADIGIRFLNALHKRKLPSALTVSLLQNKDLKMESALNRVYRERLPNQFLASLTRIVKENIKVPEIKNIVSSAFTDFLENNIHQFENHTDYKIGFVGSVAYHFQDILSELLAEYKLEIKKILPSPIDELAEYHRQLL